VGRVAVDTLLAMAAGTESASRDVLRATSIVVRESTTPASDA